MFLHEKYILGNELVQKMGIAIANISMMRKKFEHDDDLYSVQKMNNCTFINKRARNLPNYIKEGIRNNTFTDMSDKLPVTYVKSEFQATEIQFKNAGIITGTVTISGKHFYVFSPDFVARVKNCVPYILNEAETNQARREGNIIDAIKLSNDRYFTWYAV
jgi:hypothetical protein